jgi:hypothetical protein
MIITTYNGNKHKLQTGGKKGLNWLLLASCMLFMFLLPQFVSAQFININIDIPPKTGLTNNESFETDQNTDLNANTDYEGKIFALGISCAENLHILATLSNPGFLQNDRGESIKLASTLTFRNDGKSSLPKLNYGNLVRFPMSNSDRLIDYMEDEPRSITAYIFIITDTGMVPYSTSVFTGDIKLTIEYN